MLVIFVVFVVVVVEIALHAADDFGAGFFIGPLITTTSQGSSPVCLSFPLLTQRSLQSITAFSFLLPRTVMPLELPDFERSVLDSLSFTYTADGKGQKSDSS